MCRKHGISYTRFYKLKAGSGGLEVSEARRLLDECLNETVFFITLAHARAVLAT